MQESCNFHMYTFAVVYGGHQIKFNILCLSVKPSRVALYRFSVNKEKKTGEILNNQMSRIIGENPSWIVE